MVIAPIYRANQLLEKQNQEGKLCVINENNNSSSVLSSCLIMRVFIYFLNSPYAFPRYRMNYTYVMGFI